MKCGYLPTGVFTFFDLNIFIHPTNIECMVFWGFYYVLYVWIAHAHCAGVSIDEGIGSPKTGIIGIF